MSCCTKVLKFTKVVPGAYSPVKGSEKSAGFDLKSCEETIVQARGKALIDTGLKLELPTGCYGRVAPRSGLAVKNFIDVGAGVVDEDYRGVLKVVLFNHSDTDFVVHKGDRIAQLICEQIYYPVLKEVLETDISETNRGEGGFGSTVRLCNMLRSIRHIVRFYGTFKMSSNESVLAQTAKSGGDTIFAKILRKEIPTEFVYEDDKCVAFKDVNPQAPVHILVIPREPITGMPGVNESHQDVLGHMMVTIPKIAEKQGLKNGYRLVVNNGPDGGQTVYHLHVHILGGRIMDWPPG